MKETPLLLTGHMVRPTLDDSKTQTRRVMKLPLTEPGELGDEEYDGPIQYFVEGGKLRTPGRWGSHEVVSPYGKTGDRLWIKETFSRDFAKHYPCDPIWYRADNDRADDIEHRDKVQGIWSPESNCFVPFSWRPSIFMPRESSRLTLEIVNLRLQCLQDISEEDAIAEGVEKQELHDDPAYPTDTAIYWRNYTPSDRLKFSRARDSYRSLWNSINLAPTPDYAPRLRKTDPRVIIGYHAYPWSREDFVRFYPKSAASGVHRGKPLTVIANPYVWVITFKRINPNPTTPPTP